MRKGLTLCDSLPSELCEIMRNMQNYAETDDLCEQSQYRIFPGAMMNSVVGLKDRLYRGVGYGVCI